MLIIKDSIPIIKNLVDEQSFTSGVVYRKSKTCLRVLCEDGILLYNVLTGCLILIGNGENEQDYKEILVNKGFYVPDNYNEYKVSDDVFSFAKSLDSVQNHKTSFTILTTTDCNARCFYCYEMGIPRMNMQEKTARDVGNYLVKQSCGDELDIHWFGGEPLYNMKAINIITDVLRKNGVPFRSKMTSNGYYLDWDTSLIARERWNLNSVQITIDGTKETYQKTKAYIEKDPNSFERVINNIKSALDNNIFVAIRLNVDASNAKDLYELVSILAKELHNYSNYHVYAALIKPLAGKIHSFENDMKAIEEYEKLTNYIESYGIGRKLTLNRVLKTYVCMADSENAEVILPNGNIQKCEHYNEKEIIGSIYDDERNSAINDSWKELMPRSLKCFECQIYPICRHLKKCEYTPSVCSDSYQVKHINRLKRQILNEYNNYKLNKDGNYNDN